jgi:hypothetical protein
MSGSMLYTMGLALTRAADLGYEVSILVEGQWMHGQVAAHDGIGLVLEQGDGTHSVVRTERVAAVTVHSASPVRQHGPHAGHAAEPTRPLVATAC